MTGVISAVAARFCVCIGVRVGEEKFILLSGVKYKDVVK